MDVPFHNWLLVDLTLKVFWLDKRFSEVNSFTFLVLGKGLFEGSNPVLEDELFNLSKKRFLCKSSCWRECVAISFVTASDAILVLS